MTRKFRVFKREMKPSLLIHSVTTSSKDRSHTHSMFASTFQVKSDRVRYTPEHIVADYSYLSTRVENEGDQVVVYPINAEITLKTQRKVPKVGALLVGLGGNNGSTLVASVLANKLGISWQTKEGIKSPNFFGSITQASTMRIGANCQGEDCFVPMKSMVPMVEPTEIVFGGWDINSANVAEAMERAKVLDFDLQRQLKPYLQEIKPLPAIFDGDFIAANQSERANNVLVGTKQQLVDTVRRQMREFKATNELDSVIVLWTANTERFAEEHEGLNDTAEDLIASIARDEREISPSTLYAVASVLEGFPYLNGSPQNTFVPGLLDLAQKHNVYIAGDDFKSGQTKMKSVMVDWLISAGIKPVSIVSYNHLGNNDGKNLSAPSQFRSKEISKSGVVDDMVASNPILYKEGEHPDHVIVIKYVPYVGDSKRAMDEYTSEIFMNGLNTVSMHNTCEDSLLACPIILDLIILTELMTRITYRIGGETSQFSTFDPVLSILSYLLKAPQVPNGAPIVNALYRQKSCIENFLRACVGLPPDNSMLLEHKVRQPIF